MRAASIRRERKRLLLNASALMFAAAALACGRDGPVVPGDAGTNRTTQGTGTSGGQPRSDVPAAGLSIIPGALALHVGERATLTAVLVDANGGVVQVPTGALPWTSSTSSVVTVNDAGIVAAVGAGDATVSTTVGGFTGSARVTVMR